MNCKNKGVFVVLLFYSLFAYTQLNASFSASKIQGCAPLQVSFTNTSTGNPDSCFWELGISGNTSTLFNPTAIYNLSGSYMVKLTVFKGVQSSTTFKTITVFKDPLADFSVDILSGCEPIWIRFTESITLGDASVKGVQWDYGDGVVDSLSNPQHRYDFYGFKSVSLIVTDQNGCKNTILKPNYLNILDRPAADFISPNNENCKVPATVNFNAQITSSVPIQNYNWTFGDGNTGSGSSPAHVYTAQGLFPVKLIVRAANGCYDTIQKNDFVRINPIKANFGMDIFGGCVPTKISFFDSTNFINITSFWDFKDGLTSTLRNPVHTFYGAGNYNVTLTSTLKNTTCSNSISKLITIQASPVIDFTMSNTISCQNELVQFTNLTTGAVNYKWYFINADNGQMDSSTLQNPSYFFSSSYNTDFHVKLIAESSNGCTSEYYRPLAYRLMRDSVEIVADTKLGCVPLPVNFISYIDGIWPVSSILWDFGDGNTGSGANITHTYTSPGLYTVKLTVNIPGCASQVRFDTIAAGILDNTVSGSFDKFDVCIKRDTVHFVAVGGLPGTGLSWDVGDNIFFTGNFYYAYVIPSAPLMYPVKLIATNMGCSDTINVGDIMVQPPLALFKNLPLCKAGRTVTFINASNGADSCILEMGDGTVYHAFDDTIVHTFSGTDLYYLVKLTTYNKTSTCSDTAYRPIRLIPRNYVISYDKSAGCRSLRATFKVTGYDPTDTLLWEFSDMPGVYFPTAALTRSFTTPGIYSVKLIIKNISGCVDSIEHKDVLVVSTLTGTFNSQTIGGCITKDFLLQANMNSAYSAINDYAWDIDGTIIHTNTDSLAYQFADTGTAYITLKVTNNAGCELILKDTVEVKEKFASFAPKQDTICRGVPLLFENLSKGDSLKYVWNFGDNTTSRLQHPSHTYTSTGNYTVTLSVTDKSGCVDVFTKRITVTTLSVDFSADNRYRSCPELLSNFNLISTTDHFEKLVWNFGNGNESVGLNKSPSTIYTYSGNFNASLTAYDAYGCVDSVFKNDYIIISGPIGSFSFNPGKGCTPLAVEFSGSFANANSLIWDFGDGATYADSTLPFRDTITHLYISNGNFTPSIIVKDDDNCLVNVPSREVIKTGTIQSNIQKLASYVCDSGVVVLQDSSVFTNNNYPVAYAWYVNGNLSGNNSQLNQVLVYDPLNNPQKIKLITTSEYGCISSDSIFLKLYGMPAVKMDTNKIICKNEAVLLHVSGSENYIWSPAMAKINDSTFTAVPANSGYYIVTAYEDSAACHVIDSVYVNVITKVDVYATIDTFVCYQDSVQLFATASNTSNNISEFLWTPALDINSTIIPDPLVFPLNNRTYMVTISNGKCIPQSLPVNVYVKALPQVDAGGDTIIIAGMTTYLQATSPNDVNFNWIPDYNLTCTACQVSAAMPTVTTAYFVTATDTFGCTAADRLIRVIEKCNEHAVFVPNLFTPNANGRNDVLRVLGPGVDNVLNFRIYDRWGKLLFESNDIQRGWDGTFEGKPLQPGVYIYYVEVRCINNQTTYKKGDVTLLR